MAEGPAWLVGDSGRRLDLGGLGAFVLGVIASTIGSGFATLIRTTFQTWVIAPITTARRLVAGGIEAFFRQLGRLLELGFDATIADLGRFDVLAFVVGVAIVGVLALTLTAGRELAS